MTLLVEKADPADLMLEHVFPGNSELAVRMRAMDWSRTALGPVESWPQSLRTSVSTCLECAFPIVVWWGPELVFLYNDEYRPILGPAKHPAALGSPGAVVWSEVWHVIGPMLRQVMERAEATRSRDLLLIIQRAGVPEETYFSFSYSPIRSEGGGVGGVFSPVIETTEKVIGERRLRTLRDLASRCTRAATELMVYESAVSVLAEGARDVPFALLYGMNHERASARLMGAAGIERGSPAAPEEVSLAEGAGDLWSLASVAASGQATLVEDLAGSLGELPSGGWGVAPRKVLVLPVLLPGHERPRAILVAAVSPLRPLDEDYRTFFGLVATQLAAGLAEARAFEEERRRAAALAEIDRAKTAFFSNVSHEFRTPLTLMLGPLEEVLSSLHGPLPVEAISALRVAHRNSLRLLRLVNTLLEFSRIEAGRIEASYEPLDLAALTAELASVFRSAIEKAGLSLVVDCEPLPEPVYVDRDMWEKIVLNLLSNALKFTFEGEIRVSLRLEGERVVLAVSDTGVGIPSDALPRVFERFHRVSVARCRTHEGSGIGLALVHELAKLHGGEVTVTSELSRGSCFNVEIPRGSAHLPPERIGSPRALPTAHAGATPFIEEALRWLPSDEGAPEADVSNGLDLVAEPLVTRELERARVLVADDNADMREYLRRLLSRTYDVTVVADGQRALEHLGREPCDLVLSDVMMPEVDGKELIARIRADERTRTLPVILLSARAGEEARIDGLSAGADDYVVKPFSARELLARVGSQLALARLRREAERALLERSEQFEMLLNQAPIGVYLVDAELRILAVNPVAQPVFGDIPNILGSDLEQVLRRLWAEPYVDELVGLFRHTLATGEPYVTSERSELRIDRGVLEYYEWQLHRITLPDGGLGVVCYFRDISAQVQARTAIETSQRALQDADRRKNEFLATLAHELRGPLAPIKSSLHVLALAGSDASVRTRVLETMERQVSHMVRLVDDLMEVSRITRGKIELRKAEVELSEIVQSAVETTRPLIEARRQTLEISLPPGPLPLYADAVRLSQVLANLLNNAAKYTPEGGRVALLAEREGPHVVVRVRDTGSGIPPEMLSRVFDLFVQVDHNQRHSQGGLGIGLTLSRSLVELHGGSVDAFSEGPGRGSELVVRLPLAEHRRARSEPPATPSLTVKQRVLVVDDSEDAAETLGMLLELLGAEVLVAHSGSQALELVQEHRPSLVFLDIGMPEMDGYEVARKMRALGRSPQPTLIALTGWGQADDRRRSHEAGFDHHLVKPLDLATLRQVMGRLGAKGDRGPEGIFGREPQPER